MTGGPRGTPPDRHRVRRAILWLNARDADEWLLGFVMALGGGCLLTIATAIVGCVRRGCEAAPTWGDFGVLLLVLASALVVIVAWTAGWRRAVAWARCQSARAPEPLAATDPFEEAARREVEELTRDAP